MFLTSGHSLPHPPCPLQPALLTRGILTAHLDEPCAEGGGLIALGGRPLTRTWTSRPGPSVPLPSLVPSAHASVSLAPGILVAWPSSMLPLKWRPPASEPSHRLPFGLAILSLSSPDCLVRSWLKYNVLRKLSLPPRLGGVPWLPTPHAPSLPVGTTCYTHSVHLLPTKVTALRQKL